MIGGNFDDDLFDEIVKDNQGKSNRMELLKMLEGRQKDAEELELEQCFSELKGKVVVQSKNGDNSKAIDDEIESLAGQSLTDLKEMKEMQGLYNQNSNKQLLKPSGSQSGSNFYKPQLSQGPGRSGSQNFQRSKQNQQSNNPQITPQNLAIDWKSQLKQNRLAQQTIIPKNNNKKVKFEQDQNQELQKVEPTAENSRLDAIYKQLKDLQNFKDEIMGDLEEFMDDVESQSESKFINVPPQFDDVVEIVVNEQRIKANERIQKEQSRLELVESQSLTDQKDNQLDIQQKETQSGFEKVLENLGIVENEEKPFWTKFLQSDYQQKQVQDNDNDDDAILPKIMDVLDGKKTVDEILYEQNNKMELQLYQNNENINEDEYESTPKKSMSNAQKKQNELKMRKEMEKIRNLEKRLGQASKAQQDMNSKIMEHRMKMEMVLDNAELLEEEKRQNSKQYDLKNKRGLTSQISQTAAKQKVGSKPPVSSGKAIFKSRAQMAAEAEAKMFGKDQVSESGKINDEGDTFLTDLLDGQKQKNASKKLNSQSDLKQKGMKKFSNSVMGDSEMNENDIEDELRDVVFDYEGSQALVLAAEDFLNEGKQIYNSQGDNKSVRSDVRSSKTNQSEFSKIQQNKIDAFKYDPFRIKLNQDKLDEKEKKRLAEILKDVDENIDEILKEKEQYYKIGMKSQHGNLSQFDVKSFGSRGSQVFGGHNAYNYNNQDQSRMQNINDTLQRYNPSLIGSQIINSDHFDQESSVIASGKKDPSNRGVFNQKLNELNRKFDDQKSIISMTSNITGISRRSAVSLIDLDSITSGGISQLTNAAKKMPGEKSLKANAERRLEKAQLQSIESHLKRLQNTEDLSYSELYGNNQSSDNKLVDQITLARLIDECREEQEQIGMIEMARSENQSEKDNVSQSGSKKGSQLLSYYGGRNHDFYGALPLSELSQMQLAKIDQSEQQLNEAKQLLQQIKIQRKEMFQMSNSIHIELRNQLPNIEKSINNVEDEQQAFIKQQNALNQNKIDNLNNQELEIQGFIQKLEKKEKDLAKLRQQNQINEQMLEIENVQFVPDNETLKKLENLKKEEEHEQNELIRQIEAEIKEFEKIQKQVEEESETDRLKVIQEIEEKNEQDFISYQHEIKSLKEYQPETENPQQDDENEDEIEKHKLKEKFINQIVSIGEEQVKKIDERMTRINEIEKILAGLQKNEQKKGENQQQEEGNTNQDDYGSEDNS